MLFFQGFRLNFIHIRNAVYRSSILSGMMDERVKNVARNAHGSCVDIGEFISQKNSSVQLT